MSLVYKNILATLIFHDAVSEENTSLLKKNLGLEYMEILSINAENLVYVYNTFNDIILEILESHARILPQFELYRALQIIEEPTGKLTEL